MSAVDDLRSAAVLLRQRAGAATPGPWEHTGSGPGKPHMGCGEVYTVAEDVYGGSIAAPAGDCYPRGGYSPDGDMVWIATVDPIAGAALADLLHDVLGEMNDDGVEERDGMLFDEINGRVRLAWTSALKLARAVFGSDS